MIELGDKRGLLIDDIPEMRSAVRIQLTDAGLDKCDQARNIKEAIEKLTAHRYDLIVCDYNLGQGADGQQFLELVRRRRLLPMTTAFLMVTGETGYEQVSTAAEFAPDDYLLKPFTSGTLRTRLERVLEKKEALKPIYMHMGERSNAAKALAACDELLGQSTRHALDVLRIKGDLLLALERADEAGALYEDVLRQRATPWAEVGKARALAAQGEEASARGYLERALDAYPNYLAAYDSLADLLKKTDTGAAQRVVERALKVAPSTRRQRTLGGLAMGNRDFSRAEQAFRRAVEKDRTGFFKSHDDYAGLAKSCSEQGKTLEALTAVKEMGTAFSRSPELAARQAAVESIVQAKAGNAAAAAAAAERALAVQGGDGFDPATSLEIAQACFASGKADEARRIIQQVAEDHHDDDEIFGQARTVFAAAGLVEEGDAFLDATRKRMVKLNNDAVALAKTGELDRAVAMLTEAADRLVNNSQIAVNAALALLMHVQTKGRDVERLTLARRYILQARRANPDHPKLGDVTAFYAKVDPAGAAALEK
ncbi:MAG: response regulator [Candidatus Nitricoxidivorans perseverans]|uniref:Response regulator n=1 Tax=Candidatus Nitricoxidivorans perseverans TaxID=2975601 RepID=A0AA49FKN7_9PROT|nr:MAG: response regulator [Candidatus Nitricoxidivorans perseverans]